MPYLNHYQIPPPPQHEKTSNECCVKSSDIELTKVNDELRKHKEFIRKARAESKLCAIDGQHYVLVPYWFMLDIEDNSNGY